MDITTMTQALGLNADEVALEHWKEHDQVQVIIAVRHPSGQRITLSAAGISAVEQAQEWQRIAAKLEALAADVIADATDDVAQVNEALS